MKQGQFPAVIQLGDLNGQNGFKIDGENDKDYSGGFVSTAGDINSDGYSDLIIGAPGYPGGGANKGRSYVVFGGSGVGNNGVIALSGLNGTNGFKLDGENNGDGSGCSVSTAGDINFDGHADLLIGALGYPENSRKGRSYVVFGGQGVGSSGVIALSSLTGSNGFKLDGENNSDNSGSFVNMVGDVNSDGIADIAIGAGDHNSGTGRTYVLFGGLTVGSSGLISLGSLDGINGFILDGENVNDESGVALGNPGDINGDGYADMLVSAWGYNGGIGRSYVIFGGQGIASSSVINLSSFNGVTGFKLDGETGNVWSGNWLGGNGDVNGDGYQDFLIGAGWYNNQIGRTYVVFGTPGLGSVGTYSLANINGTNGFKLDGESAGDLSGARVSIAGDINADGYDDILIGAPTAENGKAGCSYLVFGSSEVYDGGQFSLANLNGFNGIKLLGEMPGDFNGNAVSAAGDINGDGVADFLIGAYGYNNGVGRSYVVFGDVPPTLVNNSLVLFSGETISLSASDLAAYDRNHDNSTLVFIPTNLTHGQFESVNTPGVILNNFTQQQIWDNKIKFVHDGSSEAPTYNITVRSDGIAWTGPISANITFFDNFVLEANQLVINQGQSVILTPANLKATNKGEADENLSFLISDLTHGQFEFLSGQNQPILTFQQQNITDCVVRFIHDDTESAPGYRVAVSNDTLSSPAQSAVIDFDVMPLLVHNQLTIGQGQNVTLTSANLFATHNGMAEPTLIFQVINIQNGAFLLPLHSAMTLVGNVTFLQQDVSRNMIVFYQQGEAAPSYQVLVTDGRMATNPQPVSVTFFWKPILTRNQFLASRGQVTVLTTDNIAATRNDTVAKDLQFVVTGTVQHGRFEQRSMPGSEITSFYQQDILQQAVQFAHDNSTATPQYSLLVWDNQSGLSSDTQAGKTLLIVNNDFPVNQGETLKVIESILNATGIQPQDSGSIVFTPIGTMQHGHFALVTSPNYPLTSFQQHQITADEILFVPDNSTTAPSGYLTVSDGQTSGVQGTVPCQINFDMAPILQNTYLKTSVGERVKITDVNLKATSQTSAVNNLVFTINDLSHGYFADNDDWQDPLNNFTQQRITNGDIIFVTDESGQSPQFKVSVWDGRLHCVGCPQPAEIVFSGDGGGSSDGSLSSTIKSSLIGAFVSGGVGLLFFAFKWYLNYKHQLNLQRTARPTIDGEAQDLYSDALLLPIAREIFSRIKIGGCLGYVGQEQYNEYVGAVSVIVAALETRQVFRPDQWNNVMTRPQKQKIIDAIAAHTKESVGNNRCCSTRTFTGFYRAEATPKMIRDKAEAIADVVQEALSNRIEAKGSRSNLRLTRTSASLNESQLKAPLLS